MAAVAVVCVAFLTGCGSKNRPGDLAAIEAVSTGPRAGNVYLMRGWIGIFSEGIDRLTGKLNAAGIRSHVYQETQQEEIAEAIIAKYGGNPNHEPLVLIGHSYGADGAINVATLLAEKGVEVDLVVTLDPVTPAPVPSNIRRTYSFYQSNGVADALPFLRGVPLTPAEGNTRELVNLDVRVDRPDLAPEGVDHFSIEKLPLVHSEIIARVKEVCPPRQVWISGRKAVKVERMPKQQSSPTTRPE